MILNIDFSEFITLIRNDIMGLTQSIPVKKTCKKFGIEDPQLLLDAIDAVSYLILHIAKINATQTEFESLYDACGMDPAYKGAMFEVIFPYIQDIRDLLAQENEKMTVRFQDLDWRLSMVVATRARHNIMVPKYTLKFDLKSSENQESESVILDSDYNNMKRLQVELQDALKSLNGRYSKKVFKFLK